MVISGAVARALQHARRMPGGNVWMEKQSLSRGVVEGLWPLSEFFS